MSKTVTIDCRAVVCRPGGPDRGADWLFLRLPPEASLALPSRGLVSVEGTLAQTPFRATLEPDGEGGHWMRVPLALSQAAGVHPGDAVELTMAPMSQEPEPCIPEDLEAALDAARPDVRAAWASLTPVARRDWIHWIVSPKKPETRARRIASTCDMLANGKRRPCCFDRSGQYSKSLSCPVADEAAD